MLQQMKSQNNCTGEDGFENNVHSFHSTKPSNPFIPINTDPFLKHISSKGNAGTVGTQRVHRAGK